MTDQVQKYRSNAETANLNIADGARYKLDIAYLALVRLYASLSMSAAALQDALNKINGTYQHGLDALANGDLNTIQKVLDTLNKFEPPNLVNESYATSTGINTYVDHHSV